MGWTEKSLIPGWGLLYWGSDGVVSLNPDMATALGYTSSITFPNWDDFSKKHLLEPFTFSEMLGLHEPLNLNLLHLDQSVVSVKFVPEYLWSENQSDKINRLYVQFLEDSKRNTNLIALFDNAPVAMAFISTLTAGFLKTNKEFRNWLGQTEESLQNASFNDFFPQKKDREDFFMELGRQGFVRGQEAQFITKGSLTHWVLLSGTLVDYESQKVLLASFIEIDRQKESERILKGYNSFLEALLSGTPDPVFYSDRAGNFSGMNKAFMELTGYGRGHWIGQSISAFLPEEERTKTPEQWLKNFRGQSPDYELEYSLYEGQKKRRFLISRGVFSGMDGKPEGVVFILKDITDLKNAEEGLRTAMERAEEANLAKTAFLANMSHEIRTPLNIILGFSDILSGSVMDPVQQNYLENIKTSGRNLLILINDILDLSKIEAGKMQLSYDFTDLSSLIREVVQIFSLKAGQVGLKLFTELFLPSDRLFQVDEVRLRQILFNLVGNAVKFTSKGSVVIEAKAVQGEQDLWGLYISVRDTGIGIQESAIGTIFESFHQADSQTTKKFGGTGLGLAITKRLVQMMGGMVSVSSEVGVGSVFSVTLPALESKMKAELLGTKSKKKISFKNPSILIVEDNAVNRLVLKEILRKYSIVIFEAEDGEEALEVLEKNKLDLVFMDIRMEKMDGIEAAQAISKKPEWSNLPIVALTALTSPADRTRIETAGFSDYLTKPVDPKTLVDCLKRFLPFDEIEIENNEADRSQSSILFTSEDLDVLGDKFDQLAKEFGQMTEEVRKSKNIGRIRQLAQLLLEWALRNQIFFLQKWAQNLIAELQGFQLKTVDERLGAFSIFLNQTKEERS